MSFVIRLNSEIAKTVYTFVKNDSYVSTQYCQIIGFGKVLIVYIYATINIQNASGEKIIGSIKNGADAIQLNYDCINTVTLQDGTVANLKFYKDGTVAIYNVPKIINQVPLLCSIGLVLA